MLTRSQINSISIVYPSAVNLLSKLTAARERKRDIFSNSFSLECAELGNSDRLVAFLGKEVSQIFRETAPKLVEHDQGLLLGSNLESLVMVEAV